MFLKLSIFERFVSETLSKADKFLLSRRIKMVSSSNVRQDGYLRVSKTNKKILNKQIVLQHPDQDSDVQPSKPLILVGIFIIWT